MDVLEGTMANTKRFESISTRLQHIAELARKEGDWVLTTLAHHIDVDFLREAFRRTRKDGASGVDGQTAEEYAANLEENLQSLLSRFKTGTYHAPPVRRTYIPKADGKKTRPIGIPTFEDKVLQRAVTMVLEAVYEQDFLDCSYGFRPSRSAHQALQALWEGLMKMGGGWVLEVDIKGFFDSLDHKHLRSFLDHRVRDGVIRRAIGKWLNAGILEDGSLRHPETGSPQGGVISPLLANIYLHEVLDKWFEREVKPRLRGRAFVIRYADDFVIVFSSEADARRVLEVLPKRFGKYGLELHPEKTRLIPFRRPGQEPGTRDDSDKTTSGSFDLLGFIHYWGKSRKGNWIVKRKTAGNRLKRALKAVSLWCRQHRHLPVAAQHVVLYPKLAGHYAYYGITGNSRALRRFSFQVRRIWRKWLNRRSDKCSMPWERFEELLRRYPLPKPIVLHSMYRAANP
jgi:group II intron reverse transcriptase/maturase